MKKNVLELKILVMMLVFGTSIVGSVFGFDRDLNGTWESAEGKELVFNNEYFEFYVDAIPFMKGTYTNNNGVLILKLTHIYGFIMDLEKRWYTKNELKTNYELGEENFEEAHDYFVRGNRLTLITDGETELFIKK